MTVLSTIDAFDDRSRNTIRTELSNCGAALVRNLPLDRFYREMVHLGRPYMHPHADRRGITLVRPRADATSFEHGLSRRNLNPHTDRAQVETPPEIIGLLCLNRGSSGGASILVDFASVLRRLGTAIPITELSRMLRIRVNDSGKLLPMLWTGEDGNYFVRYRDDEIARPCADRSILERLQATISEYRREVYLAPGDGYIISNRRWLHGRAEFRGNRLMARILLTEPHSDEFNLGIDPRIAPINSGPRNVRA